MGHDDEPEVVALPGVDVPAGGDIATPSVVKQQHDLAAQLAPPNEAVSHAGLNRAAPGSRGRAAFTLRLDPERHLRLRLLSALSHKSAQQIVTAALDAVLDTQTGAIDAATPIGPKG